MLRLWLPMRMACLPRLVMLSQERQPHLLLKQLHRPLMIKLPPRHRRPAQLPMLLRRPQPLQVPSPMRPLLLLLNLKQPPPLLLPKRMPAQQHPNNYPNHRLQRRAAKPSALPTSPSQRRAKSLLNFKLRWRRTCKPSSRGALSKIRHSKTRVTILRPNCKAS